MLIKKVDSYTTVVLFFLCGFRHISDGFVSLHAFLPFLPAKVLHCDAANCTWIQTVWSNPVSVGVGAGRVETLNSAGFTEGVFGNVSVERVRGQIIQPLQECELAFWDNEMMVLLLCANTTIAMKNMEVCGAPHFKSYSTTVAAACMFHKLHSVGTNKTNIPSG